MGQGDGGYPTRETLLKLGLDSVADELETLGRIKD
jgi:hypothetical protein